MKCTRKSTAMIRPNATDRYVILKNVMFGRVFFYFIGHNFCGDKNRPRRPIILPLISAAVIPTPIVFIFFVIIFSQIMWKNGQYLKYYKKIEILQYPDADAEEKFLLNLEGRKGAGGPSGSRAHPVVNFKIIYIYNH